MSSTNLQLSDPELQSLDNPVIIHTRVVSGEGGGPEKTILNSPRFLSELGYRGLCAYMHPPDDPGFQLLEKRAAAANTSLISIPDKGIRDWSVFRRLLEICRSENVAIWHGHDYKSNFIGLMLRRFHPMKLVTTVHGWVKFTRKTPLYYWIDKRSLKRYDHVICVSDDLLEISRNAGVSDEKSETIYNGIDVKTNRRSMTRESARQKLGLPLDRTLIGAVGRLSDEKGFDLLIEAVRSLIERGLNLHLVIAGEGDARPKLTKLISEHQLSERIQLLGHRDDLPELYQALDLYALSSYREGLPNVLLEAMAYEVPVIATNIAGIPSLVKDEQNGILVEAGSQSQLTNGLTRLTSDLELRNKFARNGRVTIENEFSFERRMMKIAKIYDQLLASSV